MLPTTYGSLVVSSLPSSPSLASSQPNHAEAAAMHRHRLAKVGGLLLVATAAAAVYMGGSGGGQPDPRTGGTSAVIATSLERQQTSGMAHTAATNSAVASGEKGHSGDWANQHGDGAAPKLWPDSDKFDPTQGQSSSRKTGDGSSTSHSEAYENEQAREEEEEAKAAAHHEHSCGKGCTEYDDDYSDDATSSPSVAPTIGPTTEPTAEPTDSPSLAPSISPTSEPSVAPAPSPSFAPTLSPSEGDGSTVSAVDNPAATTVPLEQHQQRRGKDQGKHKSALPPPPPSDIPPTDVPPPSVIKPTVQPTPSPTAKVYGEQGEYDDDELYGLICAEFDDDAVYPSYSCNAGDSKTCINHVTSSDNYNLFCGDTCVGYEMALAEDHDYNPSHYKDASWAVVCGWEAILHMNETCARTFEPRLEGAKSADAGDRHTKKTALKSQEVNGISMDACNLHAFCAVCSYDQGTKIHKNCKAHVDKYGQGALYDVTSFFNQLDSFWCEDDVQESIEKGFFGAKYGQNAEVWSEIDKEVPELGV